MGRRHFLKWMALAGLVAAIGGWWALSNRPRKDEGKRLPPGQYLTPELIVLHVGSIPSVSKGEWDLQVYGLVERPLKLSWDEFLSLPKSISVSDFHCVTRWSKLDNKWGGVLFKDIAGMAMPKPEARYATIECDGGYTTSLSLMDLMEEDVVFAYELNDGPLEAKHGGPLRLVVPKKYGYKSAKWVRKVKFTHSQELGFWEVRGYSNIADPWTEDRYSR